MKKSIMAILKNALLQAALKDFRSSANPKLKIIKGVLGSYFSFL